MRGFVAIMVGIGACAALVGGSEEADPLYRPQVNVENDPPDYYSPTLYQEREEPKPGEWLYSEKPCQQSLPQYIASNPNRPTQSRHTIRICPIGRLNAKDRFTIQILRSFLQTYFTLPVEILPEASLKDVPSRTITTPGGRFAQYNVNDIKMQILDPLLTDETVALLGITMADVNAREDWQFAFGQAWLRERMAVYSLARFFPEIWGELSSREADRQGLRRSLRQCAKGVASMFGLQPCHQYYCVMNSTLSVAEADQVLLHLCPECLKKLRWNTGFDIVERYENLLKFYKRRLLLDETPWVRERLKECRQATRRSSRSPAPARTESSDLGGP